MCAPLGVTEESRFPFGSRPPYPSRDRLKVSISFTHTNPAPRELQSNWNWPVELDALPIHATGQSADMHTRTPGAMECPTERLVCLPIGSEGRGILSLDHEEDCRFQPALPRGDQMLEMDAAAQRRGIGEEGNPPLHQGHRFDFQKALPSGTGQQEVGAASSHGRLPAQDPVPAKTGNLAAPERLGHQGIGQVGVGRDVAVWQTDQREGESGLPDRGAGWFDQDGAAEAQELAETSRVPDMDPRTPPFDLHQGREAVQPPQEPGGNKRG